MNKRILSTITCAFAVFSIALAGPKKKVHTIGDSTMSEYVANGSTNKRGWGQMLEQFFNLDNITINNRGKAGASSKSFYKEPGFWDTLVKGGKDEMKAGDFLLIQFAHNDEKNNGADGEEVKRYFMMKGATYRVSGIDYRGTTPYETYKEYMRNFIKEAKEMGVKPIVVGPVSRKYFDGDGSIISRAGKHDLGESYSIIKNGLFLEEQKVGPNDHTYDYVASAKDVADEFDDVPFINLTELSAQLYIKYGNSYCTSHLFFESDKTHTTALGAALIAREFAIQLKKQAETETNEKKKAVLQELASNVIVGNGASVTPYNGDMGLAYVGSEKEQTFTLSAFDMAAESGSVKVSVNNGFKVSLNKTSWSDAVEVKYSNSTLMTPIYVRANTSKAGISACQLTVNDGSATKTQELKIENIDRDSGEEAYAKWTLENDQKTATTKFLEASEVAVSEMVIEEGHQRVPVSPSGHKKMMLFNIEGGEWPGIDIDEVSTRYIEFKAKVPKGKILNLNEISLDICGFGGNNSCYDVYLSTKDDFSEPELLGEGIKTPKDKCSTISKELLKKVPQGQTLYIRIYPWMRVSEKVHGKCIGISDVMIKGTVSDAPVPPAPKKPVHKASKPAAKTGGAAKSGNAAAKKPATPVKKK
jgi:lysophospholipase L1-like esterase